MEPSKEMNAEEAYEYIESQPNLEVLNPFVLHFDSLSAIEKEKARDFPFMNPKEFEKKYEPGVIIHPSIDSPADKFLYDNPDIAEAIGNNNKVLIVGINGVISTTESPEETGFVPDVSENPANSWESMAENTEKILSAWEETALPDPEVLQPDDDLPF